MTIQPEPVLKRIDINRIGSAPNYETFEGLRLAKYFTIAQRVEIFQEAKPIDAYIMDAKKIRWQNQNMPWNNPADFRSQIQPIFTRAYGTEVTMSDPKDKEGQIPTIIARYITTNFPYTTVLTIIRSTQTISMKSGTRTTFFSCTLNAYPA